MKLKEMVEFVKRQGKVIKSISRRRIDGEWVVFIEYGDEDE